MAKISMEIVLSDALQQRLVLAAASQGKSLQVFLQEALYTYVEDIEDGVLSDVALAEEGLVHFLPEGAQARGVDRSLLQTSGKTA